MTRGRDPFALRLELARASGRPLLDLTESDAASCGVGWDPAELETILGEARATGTEPAARAQARDAVASYLAGRGLSVAPDRILFTRSRDEAHALLLAELCGAEGEALVASPGDPSTDRPAAPQADRVRRYPIVFDGSWALHRRSLARAVTPRTRAIVVGNPSEPTGATLSREDLSFLEALCGDRIAVVGDEGLADTALGPCASVVEATRCVSFHFSGLSGVCGLPRLQAEWLAVAGPDELVAAAVSRLERVIDARAPAPRSALLAIPALLARREPHLTALRARLAANRAWLASAALRESPWSLQWGRGGRWAVLQIGAADDEESLCLTLLERDGTVVRPGFVHGLPRHGYLVVSLMPPPETFREGLSRLDRRLRGSLFD